MGQILEEGGGERDQVGFPCYTELVKLNRKTFVIIGFLFLFALSIRLLGITHTGETWDEAAVAGPGSEYLQFWAKGDFSVESWTTNKEHPPVAKYFYGATKIPPRLLPNVAQLDKDFLPGKQYTTGRVVSAILGSLSVVLLFLLALTLYDDRVAVLASVFLALMPRVIAHDRIVGLETPLSFFVLLAVYFCVRHRWWLTGFAFGLALATRFNALLMAPLLLLPFYFRIHSEIPRLPPRKTCLSLGMTAKVFLRPLLLIFGLAGLVFFISWPWLWSNPVGHLVQSLSMSNTAPEPEFFLGIRRVLPWYYYFNYLWVTTPVVILLGVLGFLGSWLRFRRKEDILLVLYLTLPFLASFFVLKQDGVRYVFQVFPAVALAAAVGWFRFWKKLGENRVVGVVGGIGVLGALIFSLKEIHPYYLDYYNVLAGGPSKVYQDRTYEIGWWGEGIYDAVRWVNQNAEVGKSVNFAFSPQHVAPILRSDLVLSTGDLNCDYVIKNTYADWYKEVDLSPTEYQLVYEVKVAGASLATVYQRRQK